MRIALLVPNFSEYSGDARVVELQADDLVEQGNDVTIFTFRGEIKPKKASLEIIGMPNNLLLERIYRLIFPINILAIYKYLQILKSYDLIISHNYPMNVLGYLSKKLYGVQYKFWYHGIPNPNLYPKLHEKIYLLMFIKFTKITISNAEIISVSNSARNELNIYTGLDSKVITNKPNLNIFYKGIDGFEIRKKYGLNEDPVILNVGRICPHKGTHLLIDSFVLVKEKVPNAKLVIVGNHTYDYYSQELLVKSDNSIIYTGFISHSELPKYYSMCDLYATCTLSETYDLPIVEAQACGKSVIAFNIGSHPEVINSDGILIEEGNTRLFADACINKLLSK
jgi:1,2-diacylglycerol 3-alpha-glucosyltransferase